MKNSIKDSPELKNFLEERSALWWWVPKDKVESLSLNSVVETILNYGRSKDVRELFDLIGVDEAAKIFYKQIAGKKPNYHKRTINFFKLYFKRHAQRDTN